MDEKQWILDNKQHFKLYNFNTFSTQEQGRDGSRILVNGVRNEDQHLEKLSVSPQKHPTKAKQQQRTNPRRTAPATDQVLCIQFIHFKNVSVQSKVTYVPTKNTKRHNSNWVKNVRQSVQNPHCSWNQRLSIPT